MAIFTLGEALRPALLGDTLDLVRDLVKEDGTVYVVPSGSVVQIGLVNTSDWSLVGVVGIAGEGVSPNNWPAGRVAASVTLPSAYAPIPAQLAIEVQVTSGGLNRSWRTDAVYELQQDGIV